MKALSLMQPWASALFTLRNPDSLNVDAAKQWETRSWKPSKINQEIIRRDGLLIHASLGCAKELLNQRPFNTYIQRGMELTEGAIIGVVKVGEIITTEEFLKRIKNPETFCAYDEDEILFGDYRPGRYAWQFTDFYKFDNPIPMKGKLSIWDAPLKTFDVDADQLLKITRVQQK